MKIGSIVEILTGKYKGRLGHITGWKTRTRAIPPYQCTAKTRFAELEIDNGKVKDKTAIAQHNLRFVK